MKEKTCYATAKTKKLHDFIQVGSSNVACKLPLFYLQNTRLLKIYLNRSCIILSPELKLHSRLDFHIVRQPPLSGTSETSLPHQERKGHTV